MMTNSAFSDTSATNSPSTTSDESPLLNLDDGDLTDNNKKELFTNDDPLDPNNFPPLPATGMTDSVQSLWPNQMSYHSSLPRKRHVSDSSSLSSLPRSRHVSESSSSSVSMSRHISDASSTSSLTTFPRHGSESSCSLSIPRSRHVSESSISPPWRSVSSESSTSSLPFFPDEFSTCDKHNSVNDFFCNDCTREMCKECVTRNHLGHAFKPGFTYKQMFSHYRHRRNLLQEHKMKCERAAKNLAYRANTLSTSIRCYFQKVHEMVHARERKLLEELKHAFENRKLMVSSRSFEAEKALFEGDHIVDVLSEACRMGNVEKSTQAGRIIMKHLDSMRELTRKIDMPIDEVTFLPNHDDAYVIGELKSLGSIVCSGGGTIGSGSNKLASASDNYGNSWTSHSHSGPWNGSSESSSSYSSRASTYNDMSSGPAFNDYKGSTNSYIGTGFSYSQQSNMQQTPVDFGQNSYNPFTYVPPELPMTGSPVENLALAIATFNRESSPAALSQSPSTLPASPSTVPPSPSDPSGMSILPFCNTTVPSPNVPTPLDASNMNLKASTNINIPSSMNKMPMTRSIMRMDPHVDRALSWNRCATNEFKMSFHRSRNYARIRKPVVVFGQEGKGDADLCRPWGVCCDDKGHVIVADRSNNRIQVFRTDGTHVRHFGEAGSEEGQFNRPAGVAIDLQGRIVVCDKDNHRIQVFTLEGVLCLCFGRRGSPIGQFNYPWDVAVAPGSGLYAISDTRNHRIQMFTDQGNYVKQFGFDSHSPTWKLFDSPRGVCFTPESTLMCTDFNSHRLFEIEFLSNSARMVRLEHYKKCQLYRPQKLTMDVEGNILVTDCRNNRVVVFARDGRPIATFGVAGKEPGQFDRPSGMSITPDGKVVIVDFGNHRIQIF